MRYVGLRQIVIDDQPAPVPFWDPEPSFAGLTVTLIGGGPSHVEFDLDLLRGRRFIAINSGCRQVRPIATADDQLYFTDNSWAEHHLDLIEDWPGPVVCANRHAKARLGDAVRRVDPNALTEFMGSHVDCVQASSGHMAACLAARMGSRRIVLIGFEGGAVNGRTHGHNDYPQQNLEAYAERFLPGWSGLAPAFARMGVEMLNASLTSAIHEFPMIDLADALR